MKANELRIGNYLKDAKDRFCKVKKLGTDWNDNGIEAPSTKCPITTMPNYPILLTEAWLINLGMDKGIGIHNDVFSGFITVNYNDVLKCYEFKIGDICLSLIKHVHQLQNLYFALTGEELHYLNS